MSSSRAIPIGKSRSPARAVTSSFDPSTSPTATFQSPPSSFGGSRPFQQSSAKGLKPFHTQDIKVLLLENVNQTGKDILSEQGYQVESLKSSIPEDQLIEKIRYAHQWQTSQCAVS